jgi:succinate dehydrogenase / fumarate reductase cytochrome b subunit
MKNQVGIKGWFYIRSSNLERYLYTLHRITGVALLVYLLLHILVTATRAFGQQPWETIMHVLDVHSVRGRIIDLCLIAVLGFHAFNGLRLIITELGFFVGKPTRPIYPYVASSLSSSRFLLLILMLLGAIFLFAGLYEFFLSRL